MSETTAPLSQLISLVNEKVTGSKDPSMPYVGLEHIPSNGSGLLGVGSAADSVSTNNVFRKGDTLFGKLRPQLHKCLRVHFEGYCSTDILVLRAIEDNSSEYSSFILQSDSVFREAIRTEEGTKMPRCSWKSLKPVTVYCPPLSRQKKIARILTTVDNLIEKTEALIEKYKAIKQGMMHDLFTRGVDQNGKLHPPYEEAPHLYKESPLGWIPKEWECERVGDHLLRIEQGWSPDCDSEPAGMGEWGVLKTTSVVWAGYNDDANKKLPAYLSPRPEYEVKRNDVLMTRGGPNSRVGVVAFVDSTEGKRMMSDKLYRLVSKQSVSPYFLSLALSSELTQTHLSTLKTGLAESQTNISQAIVKRLQILLPTLKEQHSIETLISNITSIVDYHHEELEKMVTIKSGLMQDLLTGKVRVKVDEVEEELANA